MFCRYCSCWYWAPIKIQKLLLVIMKRSIKPCGITAAGRWKSSFEIFAKVNETVVCIKIEQLFHYTSFIKNI